MTGASTTVGKALVLGDDTRAFLAVVRSLGRRGVAVHAAPLNLRAPALASRYLVRVHVVPPWMDDGADWLAAMEALLRAERFDLVIPCNETALLPLQRHRARLGALARLAIPDDAAIAVLFDKHATRELARRLGIPVAPGRLPVPGEDAAGVLAELGTPVMVKPRRSYALDQLDRRGKVQVAASAAELAALLARLPPGEHVLEGFIPGRGLGVSLLAQDGRVLQAFEHHRVREDSSGSYYRVSAPLTPALLDACAALVAELRYTGVGMFEFRRDAPSGAWALLEVNARPWGSLPLPVALGVDLPWRWYRLLTAGETWPATGYRAGVYGRNLVPDLIAARAAGGGVPRVAARLAGRLLELRRVARGREVHDVLVADDWRPAAAELAVIADEAWRRLAPKLPGAAALARRRAAAKLRAALGGGAGARVLFVCQGNICRSPFAAAALRRALGEGPDAAGVGSAGMLPRPGRPTPDAGLAAAAALGIDLAGHRSRYCDSLAGVAAVLVFDETNRRAVLNRFPTIAPRLIKLGDLLDGADIADPVDGDTAVFAATYATIAAAVAAMARLRQGAAGCRPQARP